MKIYPPLDREFETKQKFEDFNELRKVKENNANEFIIWLRELIDKPLLSRQSESHVKLNWNCQKNVLYDLIAQLKTRTGSKGLPFIDNSNAEIALFLIQHIVQFENNKQSTVEKELSKRAVRPLSSKVLDLNLKK